jgi:hypothetical protein
LHLKHLRAGIKLVKESEVLVLELEDKPGKLGRVCRSIADAGVNIGFFYAASDTRIVLGVSELEKAEEALS